MATSIFEDRIESLAEYAQIPIHFHVREIFDVVAPRRGLEGLRLRVRAVDPPYLKDYDILDPPTQWPLRFDMSRWGILAAIKHNVRIGGAVIAWDTEGVNLLAGRRDMAVLWDLRIAPDERGKGVGTDLFRAVEDWALARGVRWLKVETQNINVPACRFYARQGCILGSIDLFAYPTLPEETQLCWYKDLSGSRAA